jgi:hypothetical protein
MANVGKTIKKVASKVVNTVTGPFQSPPAPEAAPTPPPAFEMPAPQIIQVPGPAPEEATRNKRMPTPTDRETLMAGMRSRAAQMRRRGRQSTILTDRAGDMGQKLGG